MTRFKTTVILSALAILMMAWGCSGRPVPLSRPTAPVEGYQRRITVVLERGDFRPLPGMRIDVEVEEPSILVKPAGGSGRTNGQGALALVFEPKPHYDQKAWAGDDIIVEFPVKAKLTIHRPGQAPLVRYLNDRESFARYADPLYQGLNRDPEPGETYLTIKVY